jgi:hypothetical protein
MALTYDLSVLNECVQQAEAKREGREEMFGVKYAGVGP